MVSKSSKLSIIANLRPSFSRYCRPTGTPSAVKIIRQQDWAIQTSSSGSVEVAASAYRRGRGNWVIISRTVVAGQWVPKNACNETDGGVWSPIKLGSTALADAHTESM